MPHLPIDSDLGHASASGWRALRELLLVALPCAGLTAAAHPPGAPLDTDAWARLAAPIATSPAELDAWSQLVGPGGESCGADVRISRALVDPADVPDVEGEWIELINLEPTSIDLGDWSLTAGRRTADLPPLVLEPLGRVRIGADGEAPLSTLRLRNSLGQIHLRDPCRAPRAVLSWGGLCDPPPPGWTVRAAGVAKEEGPTRHVDGGAPGGCGQT